MAVVVDVAEDASVDSMVHAVQNPFKRIDVLVNNASLFSNLAKRAFDQIPLSEWRRVMDVNVTGSFLCARAVAPLMREQGFGRRRRGRSQRPPSLTEHRAARPGRRPCRPAMRLVTHATTLHLWLWHGTRAIITRR